jgi:hypothetical protein
VVIIVIAFPIAIIQLKTVLTLAAIVRNIALAFRSNCNPYNIHLSHPKYGILTMQGVYLWALNVSISICTRM